jgi:hypothetical protein
LIQFELNHFELRGPIENAVRIAPSEVNADPSQNASGKQGQPNEGANPLDHADDKPGDFDFFRRGLIPCDLEFVPHGLQKRANLVFIRLIRDSQQCAHPFRQPSVGSGNRREDLRVSQRELRRGVRQQQ